MAFLFVDPVRDGYTPEKAQAFFGQLPDRLRSAPAVSSFALAAQPPYLPGDDDDFQLTVVDAKAATPVQKRRVEADGGRGVFCRAAEPVLAGREFEEQDQRLDLDATSAQGEVAVPLVLNDKAAHALFGKDNAVGKHLRGDRADLRSGGSGAEHERRDGDDPGHRISSPDTERFRPSTGRGITIIARGHAAADAIGGCEAWWRRWIRI